MKALREAFMLTKFSAETRSYAVAVMALVLMIVVPLYGRVRRHLDGARLLRAVTLFFVRDDADVRRARLLRGARSRSRSSSGSAFTASWSSSQMWAFAADSFNVKSGQRLFVVIMLGANLGALAGAKIAQLVS